MYIPAYAYVVWICVHMSICVSGTYLLRVCECVDIRVYVCLCIVFVYALVCVVVFESVDVDSGI